MSLKNYLKPYFPRMSLGLTIKFIGTMTDLMIPWILAHLIDVIIPQNSVEKIFLWGGAMVLCAAIGVLSNITANRMASAVSRMTIERIRHDLYTKITHLSSRQIDDLSLPSLISRLTSDSYHVHHMVGMMQRLGVRAPILLIGGLIMTLSMDWVLASVFILSLPFIGILVFNLSQKGIPLYKALQNNVDDLVRVVRENIVGIRVIKALSKHPHEKKRFDGVNTKVVDAEKKAGMTMALTHPVMNLLLNSGLTLVVLVGAFRVHSGATQTGTIIAFLTYFTLILNAMLSLSRIFILYSKGSASFNRIQSVLELEDDLVVGTPDYKPTENHIEFSNVTFAYGEGAPNLHNLSFTLKRGETLGIIGPTGSGKSSVIKLLMRFYDPSSGEVRIGGTRIDTLPKAELHTKFGVVLQNDTLFADTIKENIAFGRTVSERAVYASTQMAQAGEFIDTLTDGLYHALDVKGANLSGGQKQRLLISRALVDKPEILILDDASSALDYKTDAKLRTALNRHFEQTTAIIVAQRVSAIMNADKILVLDDGKAVGYGTHDHLLATCDDYRQIAEIQLGGAV
ncbi:ABC transporter ATP-binding protein [Fusibacter sp. JL298sf-3]